MVDFICKCMYFPNSLENISKIGLGIIPLPGMSISGSAGGLVPLLRTQLPIDVCRQRHMMG